MMKLAHKMKKKQQFLTFFFRCSSKSRDANHIADRISHATLKAILKYKNHLSDTAVKNCKNQPSFHFSRVSVNGKI